MPQRVLIVAYSFPPVGGAGVQRAVKFTKYLPVWGWSSSVLTVANPSVPVLDESLLADIPQGTRVCRARTLEPRYRAKARLAQSGAGSGGLTARLRSVLLRAAQTVLQPDPQILWAPAAIAAGLRMLRELPHDCILVTAPPFSSLLIGRTLSRRTGLPLLVDYRDEWELSSEYLEQHRAPGLLRVLQDRWQASVLRQASAVITTTEASARQLRQLAARAGSMAPVVAIYNGYDPDDLRAASSRACKFPGRCRLVYTGTLWNLTDISALVRSVRHLAAQKPHVASQLELVFAGRRTARQNQLLRQLERIGVSVELHDYLTHAEAIQLMQSANAVCLTLADVPGAERVVPAKVFEYMGTRQPIIAFTPAGELRDLLRDYPRAYIVDPADTLSGAQALATVVQQPPGAWYGDQSPYHRRHQAGQLAQLMNQLAGEPLQVEGRPTELINPRQSHQTHHFQIPHSRPRRASVLHRSHYRLRSHP